MKTITTAALAIVVLIAALAFLLGAMCAVNGPGESVGTSRAVSVTFAILGLSVMAGGVWAIAKLNRKK